jgi:hypothetical protein
MTDFVHSATVLKIGYPADHALSIDEKVRYGVAIGYAFGGSEYGGGAEPVECKDIGGDDAKTKVIVLCRRQDRSLRNRFYERSCLLLRRSSEDADASTQCTHFEGLMAVGVRRNVWERF